LVAAQVKSQEGEENWIIAEVIAYNQGTGKYDVEDVDVEQKDG
jgi:SAGA-associated factor 29